MDTCMQELIAGDQNMADQDFPSVINIVLLVKLLDHVAATQNQNSGNPYTHQVIIWSDISYIWALPLDNIGAIAVILTTDPFDYNK